MAEITLEIKDSILGMIDQKQKEENLLDLLLETLKQLEEQDDGNVVK